MCGWYWCCSPKIKTVASCMCVHSHGKGTLKGQVEPRADTSWPRISSASLFILVITVETRCTGTEWQSMCLCSNSGCISSAGCWTCLVASLSGGCAEEKHMGLCDPWLRTDGSKWCVNKCFTTSFQRQVAPAAAFQFLWCKRVLCGQFQAPNWCHWTQSCLERHLGDVSHYINSLQPATRLWSSLPHWSTLKQGPHTLVGTGDSCPQCW